MYSQIPTNSIITPTGITSSQTSDNELGKRLGIVLRRIINRAYTDGMDRFVRAIVLNDNSVVGTFVDGHKLVDFEIGDTVDTQLHEDNRADSNEPLPNDLGLVEAMNGKLIEIFDSLRQDRGRDKKCVNGIPCKGECIRKGYRCRNEITAVASPKDVQELNAVTVEFSTRKLEKEIGGTKDDYDTKSIRELKAIASEKGINRYSYMTQDQLKATLRAYDSDPGQRDRVLKTLRRQKEEEEGRRIKSTAVGRAIGAINQPLGRTWNILANLDRKYQKNPTEARILALAAILGGSLSLTKFRLKTYKDNLPAGTTDAGKVASDLRSKVPNVEKPSMTFVIGNYGEGSKNFEKALLSRNTNISRDDLDWLKNETELIPFKRVDEGRDPPRDPISFLGQSITLGYQKTIGDLFTSGKNDEAIKLAGQLYAYGSKEMDQGNVNNYPAIQVLAAQDGGIVAREALELLDRIPPTKANRVRGKDVAERVRLVTLGTPYFGLSDRNVPETNLMGSSDPWNSLPFKKGGAQTQNVRSVNGHDFHNYLKSADAMDTAFESLRTNIPERSTTTVKPFIRPPKPPELPPTPPAPSTPPDNNPPPLTKSKPRPNNPPPSPPSSGSTPRQPKDPYTPEVNEFVDQYLVKRGYDPGELDKIPDRVKERAFIYAGQQASNRKRYQRYYERKKQVEGKKKDSAQYLASFETVVNLDAARKLKCKPGYVQRGAACQIARTPSGRKIRISGRVATSVVAAGAGTAIAASLLGRRSSKEETTEQKIKVTVKDKTIPTTPTSPETSVSPSQTPKPPVRREGSVQLSSWISAKTPTPEEEFQNIKDRAVEATKQVVDFRTNKIGDIGRTINSERELRNVINNPSFGDRPAQEQQKFRQTHKNVMERLGVVREENFGKDGDIRESLRHSFQGFAADYENSSHEYGKVFAAWENSVGMSPRKLAIRLQESNIPKETAASIGTELHNHWLQLAGNKRHRYAYTKEHDRIKELRGIKTDSDICDLAFDSAIADLFLREDKQCGHSHIPDNHKCRIGSKFVSVSTKGKEGNGGRSLTVGLPKELPPITFKDVAIIGGGLIAASIAAKVIRENIDDINTFRQFQADRKYWEKYGIPDELKSAYAHHPPELAYSLLAAEQRAFKQNKETIFIFDKKGKPLVIRGGDSGSASPGITDRVKFLAKSNQKGGFSKNWAVITHNHPSVGGTFSSTDINTAAEININEIRAVGENAIYSLRTNTEGSGIREFPGIKKVVKKWTIESQKIIVEHPARPSDALHEKIFGSDIATRKMLGKSDIALHAELNKIISDENAKSGRLKLVYTRTARSANSQREAKIQKAEQRALKGRKDSYSVAFDSVIERLSVKKKLQIDGIGLFRIDKKCGASSIPDHHICHIGQGTTNTASSNLAIAGLSAVAAAALLGTAAIVHRDLKQSQITEAQYQSMRRLPSGGPDEQTRKKYETFKPGDLVRKGFNRPGWGRRHHYAVYLGKDPETGGHIVATTGLNDKKSLHGYPEIHTVDILKEGGATSTEYEVVPKEEMYLRKGTREIPPDEVVRRANAMLDRPYTFTSFSSNCESFSRGIVEGKAYSTQADKTTPVTKTISAFVHVVSSIKAPKKYALSRKRVSASKMVNYLERKHNYNRELLNLTLDDKRSDDITQELGMRSPDDYAQKVEQVATKFPAVSNAIRQKMYENYLMVMLGALAGSTDGDEIRQDKKCGGSHIPDSHQCHVGKSSYHAPGPDGLKRPNGRLALAGIAAGAGVGTAIAYHASDPSGSTHAIASIYQKALDKSGFREKYPEAVTRFEQFIASKDKNAEKKTAKALVNAIARNEADSSKPQSNPNRSTPAERLDYIHQLMSDPIRAEDFKFALAKFTDSHKSGPPYPEELTAVRYYTDSVGYREMNLTLRGQDPSKVRTNDSRLPLARLRLSPEQVKSNAQKDIKMVNSALDAMPDSKGKVYRGLTLPSSVVNGIEVGETWHEDGFTSTTKNKFTRYPGNVIFEIESNHGKDISDYEKYKNKEILFKSGTDFKITSKRKVKQYGQKYWLVGMTDIPHASVKNDSIMYETAFLEAILGFGWRQDAGGVKCGSGTKPCGKICISRKKVCRLQQSNNKKLVRVRAIATGGTVVAGGVGTAIYALTSADKKIEKKEIFKAKIVYPHTGLVTDEEISRLAKNPDVDGAVSVIDRLLAPIPEAPPNNPNWTPSMTAEEADKWAKKSSIQTYQFHGTTKAGEEGISRTGWDLSPKRRSNGRVFGDAVYLSSKKGVVSRYAKNMHGSNGRVLTVKVNVKKVFDFKSTIKVDNTPRHPPKQYFGRIAHRIGRADRYKEIVGDEFRRRAARDMFTNKKTGEMLPQVAIEAKVREDPQRVIVNLEKQIKNFKKTGRSNRVTEVYANALTRLAKEAGYDAMRIPNLGYLIVFNPKNVVVVNQ